MGIIKDGLGRIVDEIRLKAFEAETNHMVRKLQKEEKRQDKERDKQIQKSKNITDQNTTKLLDEKYNTRKIRYSKNVCQYLVNLKNKYDSQPLYKMAAAILTEKMITYTICCISGEISKTQQLSNMSNEQKQIVNGVAKLFGFNKVYGEEICADLEKYDVKNRTMQLMENQYILSVKDILEYRNSDWYIDYRNRKAATKEVLIKEKISLLKHIIKWEPVNSLNPVGFRIVHLHNNMYRMLSVIEIFTSYGSGFYYYANKDGYTEFKEEVKKTNLKLKNNLEFFYYSPRELFEVVSALEYVLPRFKEITYTVAENVEEESTVYELTSAKDLYFISSNKVEELDEDTLETISKWWNCWKLENYEQQFGAHAAMFWETKINPLVDAVKNLKNKKNEEKIASAGVEGEEIVEYALKWIAPSYYVMPRKSDGKNGTKCIIIENSKYIDEKQEIDHIVVGKQGVFLIETKYYSGHVEIDKAGNWKRTKNGVSKADVNPLQQIRRHEKIVKSIMPENVNVISILCLAHPEVIINGTENYPIPILKSDMLVEFIEKYNVENTLSENEITDIMRILEKHIK